MISGEIPISIVIFIIVDIILVIFVLWLRKKKGLSAAERKYFQQQWQQIQAETDGSHAVLNADKLLDRALSKKGYQGSLGEKLKAAKNLFTNLDGVWFAHKMRNQIAHELNFKISKKDEQKALHQFGKALRDLKVL